ncbi:hypothetical protein [Archangium sp.]|uniref:hypothetical protein n=1 Tax=Archangium sp. TaxID=1872627 RepID=UPI0039C8A913
MKASRGCVSVWAEGGFAGGAAGGGGGVPWAGGAGGVREKYWALVRCSGGGGVPWAGGVDGVREKYWALVRCSGADVFMVGLLGLPRPWCSHRASPGLALLPSGGGGPVGRPPCFQVVTAVSMW